MKFKFVVILISLLLLFGCEPINNWDGAEAVVRKLEFKNTIEHLKVNNTFEIILVQDTVSYLNIICSEKLQSKVAARIDKNTLLLDNSIKNLWLNGYEKVRLELHVPSIPAINIYKPCKIESRGVIKSDMFYLVDWGNFTDCNVSVDVRLVSIHTSGDSFGSYVVKGRSLKADLTCRGSANYKFENLITDSCYIWQKSIMDMTIIVNSDLEVRIDSKGNVLYKGDPTVRLAGTGDGDLIKM